MPIILSDNPTVGTVGTTKQVSAWVEWSDRSSSDVTYDASFSSSDSAIISVQNTPRQTGNGMASFSSVGGVNIGGSILVRSGDEEPPPFCRAVCPLLFLAALIPGDSNRVASFRITVLSTPVSGETNSVVSGQSAQVQVEALDSFGGTIPGYRGTIRFSSLDSFASLPADYAFTATDAGSHAFSLALRSVADTSPTRNLTVGDVNTNVGSTQDIFVWFQTTMDLEFWKNCNFVNCPNFGSYFCQTSYIPSGYPQKTSFIAVTQSDVTNLFNRTVTVRIGASRVVTFVGDAGPTLNNPYWNTGAVPAKGGCLSDLLATNLGIPNGCSAQGVPFGGPASVLWRFGN